MAAVKTIGPEKCICIYVIFAFILNENISFSYGNAQNDISVEHVAEIIVDFQKYTHSGCISILHAISDGFSKLKEDWRLTKLETLIMDKNLRIHSVHYQAFNYTNPCAYGRSLYVPIISETDILHYIGERLNSTNARWLLFLPKYITLRNEFDKVDIPFDCELIVARTENSIVRFTEIYRIHPMFSLEEHTVGNWSTEAGIQWTNLSIHERRNNLCGLKFTALVSTDEIVTEVIRTGKNNYSIGGYFGAVWKTLESRLNFSTHILKPLNELGGRTRNGSWTDMVRKLMIGEADIAIAAFSITKTRLQAVDFLDPLLMSKVMLYIRNPTSIWPSWFSFLSPFRWEFWMSILATFFLLSICLTVISHIECRQRTEEPGFYTLSDSFLYVLGSFCSQGQDRTPKSWACRIVHLTSFFVGVVLLAAYSAALVSFLTVQHTELPFTDLYGLLADGTYQFFLPQGSSLEYFLESSDNSLRMLLTRATFLIEDSYPTLGEGVGRMCQEPKFSFLMDSYYLDQVLGKNISCKIVPIPQTSLPDMLSIIVRKKSPYRKVFNHELQKMKTGGIIQRIRSLHWKWNSQELDDGIAEMELKTAAPIFIILGGGIILSLFFLLCEIIIHHCCPKTESKYKKAPTSKKLRLAKHRNSNKATSLRFIDPGRLCSKSTQTDENDICFHNISLLENQYKQM